MTISDAVVNYRPIRSKKYFDEIPDYEIFAYKRSLMRRLALSQIETYLKKTKAQPSRRSLYFSQINWVILHESLLKIAKVIKFFKFI